MTIQAYVTSISIPVTVKQLIGEFERNIEGHTKPEHLFGLRGIVQGIVKWSLPFETRPGDFIFWEMARQES